MEEENRKKKEEKNNLQNGIVSNHNRRSGDCVVLDAPGNWVDFSALDGLGTMTLKVVSLVLI